MLAHLRGFPHCIELLLFKINVKYLAHERDLLVLPSDIFFYLEYVYDHDHAAMVHECVDDILGLIFEQLFCEGLAEDHSHGIVGLIKMTVTPKDLV